MSILIFDAIVKVAYVSVRIAQQQRKQTTMRVLSAEETLRMMHFVRDTSPLPAKIEEHKERYEFAKRLVERNTNSRQHVDDEELHALLFHRVTADRIYSDLANGRRRLRWVDIPTIADVTAEEIIYETCESTESVMGVLGVEVLPLYLDACGHTNLFRDFISGMVASTLPILKECLPLTAKELAVLADPRGHFKRDDDYNVLVAASEHFKPYVTKHSPTSVTMALLAQLELGLQNPVQAFECACTSHYHRLLEQRGANREAPHDVRQIPEIQVEYVKAELLLSLLRSRRNSQHPA